MTAYIGKCDKCNRQLVKGERKKVAVLREMGTGFSTDGFSRYLCPQCASIVETVLGRWFGEKEER